MSTWWGGYAQGYGKQHGGRRQNLMLYSEALDNAAYGKTLTTVAPNVAASPIGSMTADSFSHTANGGLLSQNVPVISGQNYVFAKWAKYVDHQWLRVFTTFGDTWFDLLNGVVGTTTANKVSIVPTVNDWFRIMLGVTASSATMQVIFALSSANGSGVEVANTNALSWGRQVNEGLYPLRYTKTEETRIT